MHFPPSFFNIMTHLLYHFVDVLDLCGPMAIRWMYPIERYMRTLKIYVRNMARHEGSIAKRYIKDECFGFITKYLQRFKVVYRCIWDIEEEEKNVNEVFEGVGKCFLMTLSLCDLAHRYILTNINLMSPWFE